MNDYMKGKVETCLELCSSANDFENKVKLVTGLTTSGFDNMECLVKAKEMMTTGIDKRIIIRSCF